MLVTVISPAQNARVLVDFKPFTNVVITVYFRTPSELFRRYRSLLLSF